MQSIEEIDRYFKFHTSQVHSKLTHYLREQIAHAMTYKKQTQATLGSVRSSLQLLTDQKSHWLPFEPQFNCFLEAFATVEEKIRREADCASRTQQQLRDGVEELQRCKLAWSSLQSRLVDESWACLRRRQEKIKAELSSIESLRSQIQELKLACFVKMISFARDLSEAGIVNKFNQKLDLQTSVEYGQKSSAINEYLNDNIPSIEESIHQRQIGIRRQEQKLELFLNKTLNSFFGAEEQKVRCYRLMACALNGEQGEAEKIVLEPIKAKIAKRDLGEMKSQVSLHHMKKTADIVLHPHPVKQTIIQHRRTFANQISANEEEAGPRSQAFVTIQIPQTYEQVSMEAILHKEVAEMNQYFTNCSHISAPQMNYYLTSLQEYLKEEEQRQLVVFFLYQQINHRQYLFLEEEQLKFTLKIFNLCLRKCIDRFDSKTALKLLLVSLKIKTRSEDRQFQELIDCSLIWDNFQFWESTFIETVYEYTSIMVNFYKLQLQKIKQSTIESKRTLWSFFDPLIKLFKAHPLPHKSSIHDIFPEILKNVFTIYLALMKVLYVPEKVQARLREEIVAAIRGLGLPHQQEQELEEKLALLEERDEQNLKQLLRNKLVFERSLSSIIGPTAEEEEQEVATLSDSIREWQHPKK